MFVTDMVAWSTNEIAASFDIFSQKLILPICNLYNTRYLLITDYFDRVNLARTKTKKNLSKITRVALHCTLNTRKDFFYLETYILK